jgi:hypothetical protein
MLFSSFGHRLLLVFGVLFALIATVVFAKLGWLGVTTHVFIDEAWVPLQAFYRDRKEVLNPAFKLIGFSGSILAAVWTVHRGWHYAERNLPKRLEELNARWVCALISRRPELIPALREVDTIALPPLPEKSLVKRWSSWLYDSDQLNLLRCSRALDRHEAELKVLTASRSRCQTTITTAYLEVGSLLEKCSPSNRHAVLNSFRKCLEFDSKDLDALELCGRQAFALGFEQPALNYLSELAVAAAGSGQQLRHVRALRFQAEILHKRDTQTSWSDARAKLSGIIAALNEADALEPGHRNYELALAHELLAEVQVTREKFSSARSELSAARDLFQRIPDPHGCRGLRRLQELEMRVVEAEKDRDNPDVSD